MFLTSWYTEGLEREGTVKDNILLCPSLSTISYERERQEDNEKTFLWGRKTEAFFCVCLKPLECVLISSSTLICCVWVFVCGPQGLGFPNRSASVCVFAYLCILCEHARTNLGGLMSPVCMLMSNTLIGDSQCVE